MKWQTLETVKRAAAKSPKAALRATIVHWQQLCKATPKELDDGSVDGSECALCERYHNNSKCDKDCPLVVNESCCIDTGSLWAKAEIAYSTLACDEDGSSSEWKRWQSAARKMLKTLESLL